MKKGIHVTILVAKHYMGLSKIREIQIIIDSSISPTTIRKHFTVGVVPSVLMSTSVLSIAHSAAIMEQSESVRYRNYILTRMELMLADDFLKTGGKLVLNKRLSNPDHKTKFSEVWGVGCGIETMAKLLGTRPQYTTTISKAGKRMDFFTYKDRKKYIYETKGTSDPITKVPINSIIDKKSILKGLSFGTVTRAVRNGKEVTIEVYDPPVKEVEVEDNELILCLLRHYTKACFLSGFNNLAEELNLRVKTIEEDLTTIESFQNKEILFIERETMSKRTILNNEFVFNDENNKFTFGIEKNLLNALISQNYDNLLNYEFYKTSGHDESDEFSIHEDGTILIVDPSKLVIENITDQF